MKRAAFLCSLILVVLVVSFSSQSLYAATITVNDDDSGVGDIAADDGSCTLREAIVSANTNTASGATPGECSAGDDNNDTIEFSVSGTITLSSALSNITESLRIIGPGADLLAIDGGGSGVVTRIFYFDSTLNDGVHAISGLTITNGYITGGTGAGIGISGPDQLLIDSCAIVGNQAASIGSGGGLAVMGADVTILNSTIANNRASRNGGAILNNSGTLIVKNSTITGNTCGRSGGAIASVVGAGSTTLINVTLANNQGNTSNGAYAGGGLYDDGAGSTIAVQNSIIANNVVTTSLTAENCSGSGITSNGNNIESEDSCGFAATGDMTDTDPLLGNLADNGGPADTLALLPGSPAIDAGSDTACVDADINGLDQRGVGFTRCVDADGSGTSAPDIGAFEVQAFTVNVADPDPNADAPDANADFEDWDGICDVDEVTAGSQCSLRAAIQESDWRAGTDAINFSVTGTITYTADSYLIFDNLAVYGPGAELLTVDGGGNDGIFTIASDATTSDDGRVVGISDLTVTGSVGSHGGAPISVIGVPISHYDSLDLRNVVVTGNTNTASGAGLAFNGLSLRVANSTIAQNAAEDFGGGVYIGAYAGSVIITDTTIDDNEANTLGSADVYKGGGIYNVSTDGTVTLIRSSVTNNTVQSSSGGGIYVNSPSGTMNLVNTTVSGNKAGVDAGGISLQNGTINLYNATVAHNAADDDGNGTGDGGGIVRQGGTITLKNSIIAGNLDNGTASNCTLALTSGGYNIESGTDCGLAGAGDQQSADPLIGALMVNGGTTHTHNLLAGSPAIDSGDPAGCTDEAGAPLTNDQRGFARPIAAACDIGAYESGTCGDGAVDGGEECDNAGANSDTTPDACRTTCVNPSCGDGILDAGEGCDDGNTADLDGCQSFCALPTCGDGIVDTGEACDAGAANSDLIADACRATCVAASCGDGVVDAGEECDDGNANEADECSSACAIIVTSDDGDTSETASGSSGGGCSLAAATAAPSLAAIIPLALALIPLAIRRRVGHGACATR